MSATLAALLKTLDASLRIQIYETAEGLALESSHGANNAGTGHAGFCEITYTPQRDAEGRVDVRKAVEIYSRFERSKQFWAHATAAGMVGDPADFIREVPHLTFVYGEAQVEFLRARHAALVQHPCFAPMEFTTDRATIARWAPLLMEGREAREPVAATKIDGGTDVNFGVLAYRLLNWVASHGDCGVAVNHEVLRLERREGQWAVQVKDRATGTLQSKRAKFVFVGAGGGTLRVLQNSGLPEAKGLAGFPVGGQWLVCDEPAVVARHRAKVYGHAIDASPAMGGPHLDLRMLDGKPSLLFGPFATWTTTFLKTQGSRWDLLRSLRAGNIATLLRVAGGNLPLIGYLMRQAGQGMGERMAALRALYPAADPRDWRLVDAGIRVQSLRPADAATGTLNFGTEIFRSGEGSLAALLGASPGASVSGDIALNVAKAWFPALFSTHGRIEPVMPSWNANGTDIASSIAYRESVGRSVDGRLRLGVD